MGTARRENYTVSPGFSRADESTPDTAGSAVLYGNNIPISGRTDSRESVPYKEKRTLPGAPADVSWCVCVTALDPARGQSPRPGSGILTRFPFATQGQHTDDNRQHTPTFRTDLSIRLGPTDPCSTAVHMEPFSTSVFKVLV